MIASRKKPLTVLHETDGSNSNDEENSHDNVMLFEKSPSLHTSGLLVVFAYQVLFWHDSLEEFHWDYQVEDLFCLDFRQPKCNWVDTGQEGNLLIIFFVWYRCAQDIRQFDFVSRECHFYGLDDGGKTLFLPVHFYTLQLL